MHQENSASRRLVLASFVLLTTTACGLQGATQDEVEDIIQLLALGSGQSLADVGVGAGDGEFAEARAGVVGPTGRVFATEIKQDLVDKLGMRMRRQGLTQVEAILGNHDEIGLPEHCCDAILLRLVYHHFEQPGRMRSDLKRALKPDGLIAIVDITPQKGWRELPGVPDRGGHGIPHEGLVTEMEGAGFELVEERLDWNDDADRFAAVFRHSRAGSSLPRPSSNPRRSPGASTKN